MAEERSLATARAAGDAGEEEPTKAELQRRMEEARESISQTVTEIKDTVTNQYYSVKDSVNDALDWREQVRRRPVAWSVGALSAGFLTGYCIAATVKGDRRDYDDYPSYDETDVFDTTGATPAKYSSYEDGRLNPASGASDQSGARSYAAQAITGSAYALSDSAQGSPRVESSYRPSSPETSYVDTAYDAEESQKPGLIERFKGTRAFDRLQSEVGSLGNRLVDELSLTAQTVVLPALLGKVKEMFGVDLSNKGNASAQQQRQRYQGAGVGSTGASGSATSSNVSSASSSSSSDYGLSSQDRSPSGGTTKGAGYGSGYDEHSARGGSAYGTSENRGYNAESQDRDRNV